MKKIFLLLFLACLGTIYAVQARTNENVADRLIGTYMTEGNKGKVVINKDRSGKYIGTLVWTKTPGMLDSHNPTVSERSKKLAGKLILKNFTYSGDDVWEGGTIYDPEKGKTYSCKITRLGNGDLKVRGFIGFSLLGRNTMWKRVK